MRREILARHLVLPGLSISLLPALENGWQQGKNCLML
jgi:hypothetical protein